MTADPRTDLRRIPAVEALLRHSSLEELRGRLGPNNLTRLTREVLDEVRQELLSGRAPELDLERLARRVVDAGRSLLDSGPRRVVNASGVILHTNLGRAPLTARALAAARDTGAGYSNVEYDLIRGERGSRMSHLERLLKFLTGGEAALAVNNNAAAVLLALNTLAEGREVVVSRGELVEIGGSFRIPEVMEKSGGRLREVGTTNKTHARDYEAAIGASTALLLKVHASNYRIEGFTAQVPLGQLVRIGEAHGLPVMVDLGSGALLDVSPHGVAREPLVTDCLAQGADLVTFSGDKLLGGPQAGLIVGRRDLVQKLRGNPLARALRLDKLSVAALAATLVEYLEPEGAWQAIPALRMIAAPPEQLREQAESLAAALRQRLPAIDVQVNRAETAVGGGALPLEGLTTWVAAIEAPGVSANELEAALRAGDPPVIARIHDDRVVFDLRTLVGSELAELPAWIAGAVSRAEVIARTRAASRPRKGS